MLERIGSRHRGLSADRRGFQIWGRDRGSRRPAGLFTHRLWCPH